MFTLETLLAAKLLAKKYKNNILSTELVLEDEGQSIYFIMDVEIYRRTKKDNAVTKVFKYNITNYVKQHGSIESFFKALVTAEMLTLGYLIVPIEDGYLCVGGEEIYSINKNSCTCPAFLSDNSKPCKHILYKDGLLEQRSRINTWKLENLN